VEARLDPSPGISYLFGQLGRALLAPGSHFSLMSLGCALLIGVFVLGAKRLRRGRRIRPRSLLRALFPRNVVFNPSSYADLGYFYFNVFAFGIVFGWAILSYVAIAHAVAEGLTALFGHMPRAPLPMFAGRAIVTVMVFLAYELGYWLNHYLSHRVAFLWEFHKVHHSATVLTPLTNFRVHPVYMCIFLNIIALFTGLANGVGDYLLGHATNQYGVSENNIILVFFIYLYVHLQHSQLWIPFSGWVGRVLMSPAHHQVHHSSNPEHFNKNMGSCLALWDWMFGTLHVPAAEREALAFGVEPDRADAHTIRGELIAPFRHAAALVLPRLSRGEQSATLTALDRGKA
jgi:sterol desaturase/sphingolipid hydroxylase (fatty acid hydroxylase superfamily)